MASAAQEEVLESRWVMNGGFQSLWKYRGDTTQQADLCSM